MKNQFINEFAQGARVDSTFVLRRKELRTSRSGERYLSLEISDRTGTMPATMFEPAADVLHIPVGGVVHLSGIVTVYRGRKRVTAEHMAPVQDYDSGDMIASTNRDLGELKSEFRRLVQGVEDRDLRRVLRSVFGNRSFLETFYTCPAAQEHHHACIGGLLEHTVAVAHLCESLAESYDQVDRDLLVASALIHDIGKTEELSYEAGIGYTDDGRLLGHVILGERMLQSSIGRIRPAVDERVSRRLSHAILSHHGELEWGAPKRPSTIEALILHHADNLDAKVSGFIAYSSGATLADERWTDMDNLFRRPLYAPRSIDDDRVDRAVEDESYRRVSA